MRGSLAHVRTLLLSRLKEPPPGRIQLLTGPRQIGKTTLLLDLAEQLGEQAIYSAGDDPTTSLPGAWERLWQEARQRSTGGPVILLLDEVQRWRDWSTRLKAEWDATLRGREPLTVVATGSSALQLGSGSRESLAGRFERLTLSHWHAADVATAFGVNAQDAALAVVRVGGYPGAFQYMTDVARWAAYVRDAIIEPALSRDVLDLADVRKPELLRQVFAIAASSPAQIISLQKLQGLLQDRGALETVAYYLSLLHEAELIAPLDRFTTQKRRQRRAPPKLVVLNNALASAIHPEGPPDRATHPDRFGIWVENACLAHAINSGQTVRYWREEPLEVDGVIEGDWGAWAIEIKTGRVVPPVDLRGLAEFTKRNPTFRALVVTEQSSIAEVTRAGFTAISWDAFLLHGPPR